MGLFGSRASSKVGSGVKDMEHALGHMFAAPELLSTSLASPSGMVHHGPLQVATDFLFGGYDALDRRNAYDIYAADRAKHDAALNDMLSAVMADPSQSTETTAAHPPSVPPLHELLPGQFKAPSSSSRAYSPQVQKAILEASAAGIDVKPFMDMLEHNNPAYQGAVTGKGNYGVFDPLTGDYRTAYEYQDPNADLVRAEAQAKVDYTTQQAATEKSRQSLYGHQGDYWAARAKSPYPPRLPRTTSPSYGYGVGDGSTTPGVGQYGDNDEFGN